MRRAAAVAFLFVVAPAIAVAQTENLTTLSSLEDRARLSIYDQLQRERRVVFKGVAVNGLEVWTNGESFEVIPATGIQRIDEHRSDPVTKGALIGLAVGGGLALLAADSCAGASESAAQCLGAGLIILGIPAVTIGALVDWSIKERVTIYTAPRSTASATAFHVQPIIGRRGGGVGLTVRW